MTYSQGFKINVNKLNADENLLVCLKIEHPFISNPICIVNDSENIEFLGNLYIAMPFEIKKHDDTQNELPRVSIRVSNVGRSIVKWIDSSGGGRNATLTLYLTRRSNPIVEEKIVFGIGSVTVTSEDINFNLIIQNNLIKRAMRFEFDLKRSRGLF